MSNIRHHAWYVECPHWVVLSDDCAKCDAEEVSANSVSSPELAPGATTSADGGTGAVERDVDHLRAVAEAATPGPWKVVGGGEYITPIGIMVAPDDGGVSSANAAHIATFDPPTALALIERAEKAERSVAYFKGAYERLGDLDDQTIKHGYHWKNRAEKAEAERRDLVSRLGFGDNVTEPMADNDTIVQWFEQQTRDASDWQESQSWRDDCYVAGHPQDDDCRECDPSLRLEDAEAELTRLREGLEALAAEIEGWYAPASAPKIVAQLRALGGGEGQ